MKTNLFIPFFLFFLFMILLGCPKQGNPPLSDLVKEESASPIPDLEEEEADICDNKQKDQGEDGIDCGGNCENACQDILIFNELLIRHLEVVDSEAAKTGELSFGKLMERLAPSPEETIDLVFSLTNTWLESQEVNGVVVPALPIVSEKIIRMWKQNEGLEADFPTADWKPNLEKAPFRLLAITNRVDLNDLDNKSAGEGRLTFGFDHDGANDFTLILEYNLPGETEEDVIEWAQAWHALSNLDKNSNEYLESLKNIVLSFTSQPEDLNQLRTNEGIRDGQQGHFLWEMREFNLREGKFVEVTRKQSPNEELNNSTVLASYLRIHGKEISDGVHNIQGRFAGAPFLAGGAKYSRDFVWQADGFDQNSETIQKLNTITCVGCHGGLAPNTNFTHIKPRAIGQESNISLFLEGDLIERRATISEILGQELTPLTADNFPTKRNMMSSEMIQVKELLQNIKKVKRVH